MNDFMLKFTADHTDMEVGTIPMIKLGEINGHPIYKIDDAYSSSDPLRVAEDAWMGSRKTRRFE